MAELLAKFHNAAEGFIQPPGIKIRVGWGKRMERCRVMTIKLEKYCAVLKRAASNEFEEMTAEYAENLLKRARASMKVLRSLDYLNSLEGSMKRKEICLNAISSNTAVVVNEKIIITKVFEMGYNMVEEDIASLISKVIQETQDAAVFDRMIEKYQSHRYLGEKSINIIKALVSYPFESIKVITRYQKHPELYGVYLEKFRGYVSKERWTDILGV
jgi:Ser/Thr protein kinase RdoA (MazF antagonist)